MSEEIDHPRRRFFGTAAMSIAAVQFGIDAGGGLAGLEGGGAFIWAILRGSLRSHLRMTIE